MNFEPSREYMERFVAFLRRHPRASYFVANGVWAWLGIACVLFGVGNLINPNQLSGQIIHQTLHPFDYLWNTGFIASGIALVWGVTRAKVEWEYIGLILFAFTIAVYSIGLVSVLGLTLGSVTYPALIGSSVLRALWLLSRGVRQELLTNGHRHPAN